MSGVIRLQLRGCLEMRQGLGMGAGFAGAAAEAGMGGGVVRLVYGQRLVMALCRAGAAEGEQGLRQIQPFLPVGGVAYMCGLEMG